ncbi:RNA polymerase subunit sigma [Listeria ivanovii]|nr:RNA polymerase subunit sigma [Listeria ivanovii]PZF93363.1 RNA polymerase subunit sigma [Listeria ivanovii]PZG04166.1 RNA polymerase subunit sigma [Listeria ivanovii]PZG08611.1 RNA polymerase subunit sigma [Listeria ivanovii]PZG25468.1 RNA polymerase subunit sigma [Listeria ivanovii]
MALFYNLEINQKSVEAIFSRISLLNERFFVYNKTISKE